MTVTSTETNRRVLVIDDLPAVHDDFRKVLGSDDRRSQAVQQAKGALFGDSGLSALKEPFELEFAYQGQVGCQMVAAAVERDEPYAVVFVDMRMPPGWDGLTTIQRIWSVDENIETVICTAYSDYTWEETVRALKDTRRLLILKKPFDPSEVRQIAESLSQKWCDARSSKREMQKAASALEEQSERVGQLVEELHHETSSHLNTYEEMVRTGQQEQQLSGLLHEHHIACLSGRLADATQIVWGCARHVSEELCETYPRSPDMDQLIRATRDVIRLTQQLDSYRCDRVRRRQHVRINEILREVERQLCLCGNDGVRINVELEDERGCITGDMGEIQRALVDLCYVLMPTLPFQGTLRITSADDRQPTLQRKHSKKLWLGPQRVASFEFCEATFPATTLAALRGHVADEVHDSLLTGAMALIQKNRGKIDVACDPDVGTTIAVAFPLSVHLEPTLSALETEFPVDSL